MGICRRSAWVASLLIAMLVAGCATPANPPHEASPAPGGADFSLGKSSMSEDELRDLQAQPFAEQRRRLDVVLASHPDDVTARFLRTQAEFKLADGPALIEDSEAVLATTSLSPRLRLRVLDWRAEALLQVERRRDALLVANQALDIDGSDADALFTRGWTLFLIDNSQTESALADIDRALQLEPDQGIGYYRRGSIFRLQGKFDRAAEDFERALRLEPEDAPTHLTYGLTLLQTRDFAHALVQFDAAARLTPRDPAVWAWRSQAHAALKRFDEGAADANQAIDLGATSDDLAAARASLAAGLENQMDYVGAAREYQRSLALQSDPAMANGLARMQWYSGQFPQAVEFFRAQAAQPDSSPYTPLWLFIMRGRANPTDEAAAKAELAELAPPHRPRVWTDTLVDLMLGKSTLDAALAEADASSTYQLKAGRRCEADYYAAEQLLMHGQTDPANRLLEEAYWVCPSTYREAKAVVAERRLLAARSPAR